MSRYTEPISKDPPTALDLKQTAELEEVSEGNSIHKIYGNVTMKQNIAAQL